MANYTFVNLDTLHTVDYAGRPPHTWGSQINSNQNFLYNRPFAHLKTPTAAVAAGEQVITFTEIEADNSYVVDSSTLNRLYARRSGLYLVSGGFDGDLATTRVYTGIKVNATTWVAIDQEKPNTGNARHSTTFANICNLDAGDYIDLRIGTSAAGCSTYYVGNWLQMMWVGEQTSASVI